MKIDISVPMIDKIITKNGEIFTKILKSDWDFSYEDRIVRCFICKVREPNLVRYIPMEDVETIILATGDIFERKAI